MRAPPAVRLEPLQAEHASGLFAALSDPSLYRYLDEAPPPSLEWLESRFAALERGAPSDREEIWLNWVIVDPDGRLVGTTQATIRADGPASVAYVLVAEAQGRGIGRAAVDRMLDLLALEHGVADVRAEIDPANARSIRLVEALGFTPEEASGPDRRFVRRAPA